MEMNQNRYEIHRINTLVIGSGAAGLNAAIHFIEEGGDSSQIMIATEKLGAGTSFNAGSDKQTYYKLSLSGNIPDSVYEMAETYWKGGSMHGDIALVESANSVREFMHLVSLGVPFPTNRFGEYIGYKTDNDPLQRATSVGPLTSNVMGKILLKRVNELDINILNQVYCCKIINLKSRKIVIGLRIKDLSKDLSTKPIEILKQNIIVFIVDNIIAATGGSSAIYKNSVYPESQWGSLGLLIDYGCETQNLTESQFGLASTDFRWNVSGSYQQVIPTYLSAEKVENIHSATEFLNDYFPSKKKLLNAIFLKGYQWPFNAERIKNHGSSLIDLLVFKETTEKGRKVFLDYSRNPYGLSISEIVDTLNTEHSSYLTKSGINTTSEFEFPVERLKKINLKAYQLYQSHDIDLETTPLAISVCAQHCNGGISGDIWWESSKSRVFVVGEANGSHGVHRPGGAALNSGQVGGLRASLKIVRGYNRSKNQSNTFDFSSISSFIDDYVDNLSQIFVKSNNQEKNPELIFESIQNRMKKYGTIKRTTMDSPSELETLSRQVNTFFQDLYLPVPTIADVLLSLRAYDAFITHLAYLHSINCYISEKGGSRGSYLIDKTGNLLEENLKLRQYAIKCIWNGKIFKNRLEKIRDIPHDENWFETVWKSYENGSWIE